MTLTTSQHPRAVYASDAQDGAKRILEFRAMVKALNDAGLRVGMDVVYNHTSASGQNATSVLDRVVPGYYHRLNDNGAVFRDSCCDDTATENMMMGKLMIDSVSTWARDYKISSFRFDIMGLQPRAVMQDLKAKVAVAAGRDVQLLERAGTLAQWPTAPASCRPRKAPCRVMESAPLATKCATRCGAEAAATVVMRW